MHPEKKYNRPFWGGFGEFFDDGVPFSSSFSSTSFMENENEFVLELTLPNRVDVNNAKVELVGNNLKITLPKVKEPTPLQIERAIEVEAEEE